MRRMWIALVCLTAACGMSGPMTDSVPASLPMAVSTVPGVGSLPNTVPIDGVQSGVQGPLVVITRPVTAEGVIAQ